MPQNKVSIIIPCYKQAQYLPEAVESILNQSHTNWECIIVNDGSPDNTKEVADEWVKKDSRFKYIKKENGGLSSARNAGIKVATGDFFQFLDADDLLEKDKLKIQVEAFETNQRFDIIYSPVRYFKHTDTSSYYKHIDLTDEDWMPQISGKLNDVFVPLIFGNIFAVNCPLVKKKVIQGVGLFNENLKSHEDYDYWNRAALKGFYFHFLDIANTYALVRVHDKSMSKDNVSNNMFVGKHLAKYYLLEQLFLQESFKTKEIEGEKKYIKKCFVRMFLNKEISNELYKTILNPFDSLKNKILPIVPHKLRYHFLILDLFEIRKKATSIFKSK